MQENAVKILNDAIKGAIDSKASDIHIENNLSGLQIIYRIDGIRTFVKLLPSEIAEQVFSRMKVLIQGDITRKNMPQEGRFCYEQRASEPIDIRVIIVPTAMGEKAVLRILNRKNLLRNLEQLGMNNEIAVNYRQILEQGKGLILICGSTGSGKTTTMYASLLAMKIKKKHVITIEEPVEYVIEGINQMQVDRPNGLGFAQALRYILRMDPDVIFVGEIRDCETAEMACSAALTGHLVVATLHSIDSIGAISRLFDMGVKPFLIAHSLKGILAQDLIPRFCTSCIGEGCPVCDEKGVVGRTALFELFTVNSAVQEYLVSHSFSRENFTSLLRTSFYMPMLEDAKIKLKQNKISNLEMEYYASGKNN